MKLQDIGFIVIYSIIILSRNLKLFLWGGFLFLLLSIPLYAKWIFFTAERLVWYAAGFFLTYLIVLIAQNKSENL
jgi:hypothetical protein